MPAITKLNKQNQTHDI